MFVRNTLLALTVVTFLIHCHLARYVSKRELVVSVFYFDVVYEHIFRLYFNYWLSA